MSKVILDWDTSYNKGVIISDMLEHIRLLFSVPNKNEQIIKRKYGSHVNTPKRFYAITQSGRFELGLFYPILDSLKTSSYEYEIVITETLQKEVINSLEKREFQLPKLSLEPREFQISGINKAIKYGNGLYIIGTGGGKTLLMALLERTFKQFNKKICIILLPAHLVTQTTTDFITYGIDEFDICKWDGDNELTIKPIIIASYNILQSKLGSFKHLKPKELNKFKTITDYNEYLEQYKIKEQERIKLWKKQKRDLLKKIQNIDLLLLDECHTLRKNNKLNGIISLFTTKHKFGFTGTLPEDLIDQWNIMGKIGPILENISSYELREQGLLSNVNSQIIQINYKNPIIVKPNIKNPVEAYYEECDFIYNNTFRNNLIVHFCNKFDNNTLIMVDRLNHGNLLYELLSQKLPNKQVYWIRGEVEMKDREVVRNLMESNKNIICIAMSKIFSTGINISNLHYILFAQGGKAKITLIQSIGRGLRLHQFKNQLIIIDLADVLHYGLEHLEVRLSHYNKEQIKYEIRNIHEP